MLNSKSGAFESNLYQIVFTFIVVSLIVIAEIVLIGETAAFLRSQGKSHTTALSLAACVALLIPVVPGLMVGENRLWIQIVKWLFVSSLITMQVYFASQTAIAPELKKMATGSETELIEDYKSQLAQYDNQIQVYQNHIDSFPDSFRTKRAELSGYQLKLIEDRRNVLADLRTISQKPNSKPDNLYGFFQHLTIMVTIMYRLALELGVVIMICSLHKQFVPHDKEGAVESQKRNHEKSTQQSLKRETEKAPVTPRNFVLSIYPLAYCKSKNGRKGPFVIYAGRQSQIEIAKAKGTAAAWQKAAEKLRTGSVRLKQETYFNNDSPNPKVYAIKS